MSNGQKSPYDYPFNPLPSGNPSQPDYGGPDHTQKQNDEAFKKDHPLTQPPGTQKN